MFPVLIIDWSKSTSDLLDAQSTMSAEPSVSWVHSTADFVWEYKLKCWEFVFIQEFELRKLHFKRLRNKKNQTVCISWFINTSHLFCYIWTSKRRTKNKTKHTHTQIKNTTPAHVELIYIICVCRCCDDHG